MKQPTRGGKREGAGRKTPDKKVRVVFYIPGSEHEILGDQLVKQIGKKAISAAAKKKNKIF